MLERSTLVLCACLLGVSGCLPATSEAAFVEGATEIRCESPRPACYGEGWANCQLNEDQYTSGTFPGSRKILVETPRGDWKIQVRLFLDPDVQPRFPGSDTEVSWFEPGCSDQYKYLLSEDTRHFGDLFERAGVDNVFEVEHAVVDPGEHLVTVYSDAVSRYLLRIRIIKDD
jgi:hypothetical protein